MNNSRKILNKIFKTGLITASSLTLLMNSGAFAAAGEAPAVARQAKKDGTRGNVRLHGNIRNIYLGEVWLDKGTNGLNQLSEEKGAAENCFIDGSTLQLSNIEAHIYTGNQSNIRALDLHGQKATLNVEGYIKLGSVVNTAGGDKKLQVIINDAQALTLTGTGTDDNLKFFSGAEAMPNSYAALDNITLGDQSKLIIDVDKGGNLTNNSGKVADEINFQGSGVVQGNTGQGETLKDINIQGDDTKIVELQGDVATKNLNFVPANGITAGTVQIGGDLTAENVIFSKGNVQGGILEFNGQNKKGYVFSAKVENGGNGMLKVNTYKLRANDVTIGDIKTIDIQEAKTFIINADREYITLLKGGNEINFVGVNSRLIFRSKNNATINLAADLPAFANGGGKLVFIGDNNNALTINSDDANVRRFGNIAGDKLAELTVVNNVIVTDLIDISGTRQLNIIGKAKFVDQGATSAKIPQINIGAAFPATKAPKGDTIYTLDAKNGDFGILTDGNTINFMHEDAAFMLRNSAADDRTITLANTLDPGDNNFGKVVIDSIIAGKTLTIGSADNNINITLGTQDHKLKELILVGNGIIAVQSNIFANDIWLGNANSVPNLITCKDINGDLTFGADTHLIQNGNINGNVNFQNRDATITLANGKNITGDVFGDANGTIEFLGDGKIKGEIEGLKMLKVGEGKVSLQADNDYVINEIQGTGTKMLTLPEKFTLIGAINSTGGEPLKLNFTNDGSISGVVGTEANPVGDITTNGVTRFDSAINSNGNIILSKGSTTEFVGNITAMNVIADDAIIKVTNDLAFNSDLTGSDTTISLGTSQITYTGQANFSDQLTILANYHVVKKDGGNILITAGSKIDLSQVTDLQINFIAPDIDINEIDKNKHALISSEDDNGLVLPADKINITVNGEQNRFVKWSIDESSLTVSAADISKEVLKKEAKETSDPIVKEVIEALLSGGNNDKDVVEKHQYSPAVGGVVNQLGRVDKDKTPEIIKPLIQNKINPSTVVRIHTKVNNIVNATLNTRMNNFVAEAAGDETETKLGVWVSPFIGNSEQKIKGDVNDYKAKSRGATLGFDGFVTDDLLLGTSYTRVYTIMKHKNDKLGDESRVKSDIYSLYGLYDLPNSNLFFSGIALYSNSLVKNYSQRPMILAGGVMSYQTAIGKHRSHSYTGQILAGYDYLSSQAVNLKPIIGIRYSKFRDASYLETGTSFQNLTVKGATSDLVEGIVGFRASKNINTGHMILTPELYSFVHRHFKDKSQLVDARLPGMTNPFPNSKINQAKISFNVGGSVTAKYKMMEYGINYNANIANKYLAQQCSLKVRVNF
ncbi:autotransporter family protein [Rickettsia endosymbiont of Orchestes rusci]|uniref:autotransporter family protein n=1 Tax=Rickettsia endosymbiont of Orchestes rusci TaxID=3066250 RepID=UPI00313EDAB5